MLALFVQDEGWRAAGHAPEPFWQGALAAWGPWLVAVVIVVLVGRALLHSRRYRAVGVLSESDLEAVHAALRSAESRTIGEIVPAVVERSDAHPDARWLSALCFVLVGSAALEPHLPWHQPPLVLLVQLAMGLAGYATARALPGFARMFVREARATQAAEEQARQEFHLLELHSVEAATGVLIFVSLFERRVVVFAAKGIDAQVAPDQWQRVDEAVLQGIARGSLRDGLIEGIARAGAVLAEKFPPIGGDRNEIPDRVIVRAE